MVVVGVELLDDHDFGLVLFNHFHHAVVHADEALRHVGCAVVSRADDAGLANDGADRRDLEDAVTGDVQPRVDAEDASRRREACHGKVLFRIEV